jgi:hypothetical protein
MPFCNVTASGGCHEPWLAEVTASRGVWPLEWPGAEPLAVVTQTGSQLNTSPDRSSGMNEGFSAGKAISATCSGVQPPSW